MQKAGMKQPQNMRELYETAFHLRNNRDLFGSHGTLTRRETEIMTHMLDLLADAAWRQEQKGPVGEIPDMSAILRAKRPAP